MLMISRSKSLNMVLKDFQIWSPHIFSLDLPMHSLEIYPRLSACTHPDDEENGYNVSEIISFYNNIVDDSINLAIACGS